MIRRLHRKSSIEEFDQWQEDSYLESPKFSSMVQASVDQGREFTFQALICK